MEKDIIRNLNRLMQFPAKGIFSTVLAESEKCNYSLMCLSKGTSIDEHASTRAGVVIVLDGKGCFTLSGKDIEMKPGMFIHMPAYAPHKLKAQENLALVLLLTE